MKTKIFLLATWLIVKLANLGTRILKRWTRRRVLKRAKARMGQAREQGLMIRTTDGRGFFVRESMAEDIIANSAKNGVIFTPVPDLDDMSAEEFEYREDT